MNAPAPSVSRAATVVEGVPRGLKPVDILGVLMYGLKPVPFKAGAVACFNWRDEEVWAKGRRLKPTLWKGLVQGHECPCSLRLAFRDDCGRRPSGAEARRYFGGVDVRAEARTLHAGVVACFNWRDGRYGRKARG